MSRGLAALGTAVWRLADMRGLHRKEGRATETESRDRDIWWDSRPDPHER
jgi:hypothetical protein